MIRNIGMEMERRPANVPESEKDPWHTAEGLVLDFLKGSEIGFVDMKRSSTLDRNDKNGIDAIGEVAGDGEVAIDITFNTSREKLLEKKRRNFRNPCVCPRDEGGHAISDSLPRILICDTNPERWIEHSKEAEARGGILLDPREDSFRRGKQKKFLIEILDQIDGLSRRDDEYRRKIEPARKIFEEHYKRLEKIAA